MGKYKRMVIAISFTKEDDYNFVKNKPNASHYIRMLVKNDRENTKQTNDYIDKRIEELREELKNQGFKPSSNKEANEDIDENLISESYKNILGMYQGVDKVGK